MRDGGEELVLQAVGLLLADEQLRALLLDATALGHFGAELAIRPRERLGARRDELLELVVGPLERLLGTRALGDLLLQFGVGRRQLGGAAPDAAQELDLVDGVLHRPLQARRRDGVP